MREVLTTPARPFTGRQVSVLTLGTAALVQPYAGQPPPTLSEAKRIINVALDRGVTLIDTAPAYGTERLVGDLLMGRSNVMVATKVSAIGRECDIRQSLDDSRAALRRWRLDLVQLHNPRYEDFQGCAALDVLREQQAAGRIRRIGAAVYSVAEAEAAIHAQVDTIQVPYNLLDQRMAETFALAAAHDVNVLVRSPWLRGALVGFAPTFEVLAKVNTARWRLLAFTTKAMAETALRFCLSAPFVASVLVGPRSLSEVCDAINIAAKGTLPLWRHWVALGLGSTCPDVIDPRRWDRPGFKTRTS